MFTTPRRIAATLAGAALASAALAVNPVSAGAAPANAAVEPSAAWLAGRLADGVLPSGYGASVDAALGFLATGTQPAAVDAVVGKLDEDVTAYTDYAYDYDGVHYEGTSSGSIAKAGVLAGLAGDDPTDFGGTDLVADLLDHVHETDPLTGRLFDDATADGELDPFGDYANSIGQSFAARLLVDAHEDAAEPVLGYLLQQQCPGGGFELYFPAADSEDQGCASDALADPDTTSFVILNLLDLTDSPVVADAVDHAAGWLAARQGADGGFGGGTSTETPNANSTGLAGWALGSYGNTAAAAKAAAWLNRLVVAEPAGCPTALTDQTGGIAYDSVTLTGARTDGITDYQWDLATSQAFPALQWLAPVALIGPGISGPTGFQRPGAAVSYRLENGRGNAFCLTAGGVSRLVTEGANGFSADVTLPAVTGPFAVSFADHTGVVASTVTQVLGSATLGIKAKKQIRLKKKLKVTASGLAAGEQVTITFRGKQVATGLAAADGTFTASFKVTKKLVKKGKKGKLAKKGQVVVTGQFADRAGKAGVKVKH